MKREYLDKLACWFRQEIEGFKVKGTSEEILREAAFTNLLVEAVFKKHIEEILFRSRIRRRNRSAAVTLCQFLERTCAISRQMLDL